LAKKENGRGKKGGRGPLLGLNMAGPGGGERKGQPRGE